MNADAAHPILKVENLRVEYPGREKGSRLIALSGVSFTINAGETFCLVGESGSGKSTLARAVTKLVPVSYGTVEVDGVDVTSARGTALQQFRKSVQMVFQDPYSSLNPMLTIRSAISEPLLVSKKLRQHEIDARVEEVIEQVGLLREHLSRYPHEFSGGQRQRIAIARAIASRPRLLIADEALSALDVSTQNQIIGLFEHLRKEYAMAYLFIAHDLAVVRHIADKVGVMYLGRLMEMGPSHRLYSQPAHPYTKALISAAPVPNPARQRTRKRITLRGEIPSPLNPPSGCVFRTRCPEAADICSRQVPDWSPIAGGGVAACHLLPNIRN